MKKLSVIKALGMMDERMVRDFLDNDCRSINEILDAVVDERERSYISFMVELFEVVDKIEAEEKEKEKAECKKMFGEESLIITKYNIDAEKLKEAMSKANIMPKFYTPEFNIPDVIPRK